MLLKKYLKLSKGEIFLLILLIVFSLFVFLGINVEKNSFSVFSAKIPLNAKGKIGFVLWKNYHAIILSFLFFSSIVLSVSEKDFPLLRVFSFLLLFYLIFSLVFGIKFGFNPFLLSLKNTVFMLLSVFAHLYFFETIIKSRLVGGLYIVFANSFSGLIVYLHNFREIIAPDYAGIIEATYRAFPIYQKFFLNPVDFKDLIFPALLIVAGFVFQFIAERKLKNA